MHFTESIISGKQVLISRSGYTGEDGFEIYIPWEDAPFWWDKLMDAGASFGIKPCGLGARDILRIEAGYPLYGYEIDDTTNPYEASLGWAVKLSKNFIAKEKILAAKQKGLERKRIGFLMQERALPRQSYVILSKGKPIGRVSSGTYSPNLDKFIGMGYVESIFSKEGTNVDIQIRDKFYRAKIVQFPFVRPAVKNNTKIFLKNRQ
jgi:aminomethyltransferase